MRIATWNIRLGVVDDGDHRWERRREIVASTICRLEPDVLCLQEAYDFQLEFLLRACPTYASYGVGREDGVSAGEHAQILVRRSLAVVDSGGYWLSEAPDVPGSMSWETACTRQVTWIRLEDGATIVNTHWDHRSSWARRESARLMRGRVAGRTVICGDFNAEFDSPEMVVLAEGLVRVSPDVGGTFHDFSGDESGDQIDHIIATNEWRCERSWIDRSHEGTIYGSDHFAVVADLVQADVIA